MEEEEVARDVAYEQWQAEEEEEGVRDRRQRCERSRYGEEGGDPRACVLSVKGISW